MKLTSIIIPTYNHALFVEKAVRSCLAQTRQDNEIIVIDDGSTDNTATVLNDYLPNIRYIKQENKGLSAARNAGIRAAKGDYFLFLDADDWIPPQKVRIQADILDKHPDIGVVYSAWIYMDEKAEKIIDVVHKPFSGDVLVQLLLRQLFFPPGAVLVRKECLEKAGYFDENLPGAGAEDTDLWIRIAKAGFQFFYIDQALFYYRMVRNSMSKKFETQAQSEFARLDKFFNQDNLPEYLSVLKSKAYSILYFEYSAKYFNAGNTAMGMDYLKKAVLLSPEQAKDTNWVLEWIAGYCLDPEVKEPEKFIQTLFDNLPIEANYLEKLRYRSIGRYHTASIFHYYKNKNFAKIRSHILATLLFDPKQILNKGFLRIAFAALRSHKNP